LTRGSDASDGISFFAVALVCRSIRPARGGLPGSDGAAGSVRATESGVDGASSDERNSIGLIVVHLITAHAGADGNEPPRQADDRCAVGKDVDNTLL